MSRLVLEQCSLRGHEQVCFFNNPAVGLRAIVAIHDTTLGPALGGCRMRIYSDEDEALDDVLRLSEGMTYKSALADLPLGGGKSSSGKTFDTRLVQPEANTLKNTAITDCILLIVLFSLFSTTP